MLSLKPFLHRDEHSRDDLLSAHRRMIASLLDGIVIHAVRGDALDYARLESDMVNLRDSVSASDLSSADLLISTGSALKAIQDYNRRTGSLLQAQALEVQKITGMLTQAIVNLAVEGSTNVSRLQALERQLELTSGLEDVRSLKQKLSECLMGIREEKLRQKSVSEATVQGLSGGLRLARSETPLPSADSLDPITGLSTRPAAENAIALAADSGTHVYAALFVIDHLHGLNTRFGRAVGDQTIMLFAQHLAQHLRPQDAVYRWSGPAFLALLTREDPAEKVRRELAPVASARLELNVESRGRAVLLPINFSWTFITIPICGKAGAVVDQLDAFLASKVGF